MELVKLMLDSSHGPLKGQKPESPSSLDLELETCYTSAGISHKTIRDWVKI